VIEKAKKYAKSSGRSLSDLIESYLKSLVKQEKGKEEVPNEFKDLYGAVKLPADLDHKKEIREIRAVREKR